MGRMKPLSKGMSAPVTLTLAPRPGKTSGSDGRATPFLTMSPRAEVHKLRVAQQRHEHGARRDEHVPGELCAVLGGLGGSESVRRCGVHGVDGESLFDIIRGGSAGKGGRAPGSSQRGACRRVEEKDGSGAENGVSLKLLGEAVVLERDQQRLGKRRGGTKGQDVEGATPEHAGGTRSRLL